MRPRVPLLPRPMLRSLRRAPIALLVALAVPLTLPGVAPAFEIEPDQVVVKWAPGSDARTAQAAGDAPTVLKVRSVSGALRGLRRRSDVVYAVPNVRARAAQDGYIPNDPGRAAGVAGGWQQSQWNFVGPFSVNAPKAWANAIAARVPGGRGVRIAVLDTGVAYRTKPPYRISPDFRARGHFVRGYDFVARDAYPTDRNGHGTHVAGTIGEATNNGIALTGLAYGARIMPVRVLDAAGEGNASDIASGIRFAAKRGAQVINLSLEFDADVGAADIPQVLDAIAYARRRGAILVAASGNEGHGRVAYPARAKGVVSVGATTERGCVSEFSNYGSGLDLVAPGGGADAALAGDAGCRPDLAPGRNIFQVTLLGSSLGTFGIPLSYEGTSMATPHVSAAAALVIATKVIGRRPTPTAIERHLKRTARDLGPPGYDRRYGWGLLDAAAATAGPGAGVG